MALSKPEFPTISFADIVKGRDANVRVSKSGKVFAVDLAMVVTGKDRDHAGQTLRSISEEIFLSRKFSEENTGGSGNSRTKLVSFKDALELIMVLPGKIAMQTRAQFAHILTRYMAGDQSMHDDINANAASDGPIPKMAREALKNDDWAVQYKRKREELELLEREEDIKSRAQARIESEVRTKREQQAYVKSLKDELTQLSAPDGTPLEERARLLLKDTVMNQLLNEQQPKSSDSTAGPSPNKPISIASVAKELGIKLTTSDSKKIGIDLKKRYMRANDGKAPPKHEQVCDGLVMKINSYSEQERALVEQAIRAHFEADVSDEDDGA